MLSFILANMVVQGLVIAGAWWGSGFDPRLSNDDPKGDFVRRAFRCFVTFALVEVMFWGIWRSTVYNDRTSGFIYIAVALPLALYWSGCLGNMLAHCFQFLIDSNDKRAFDPKQEARILDSIGVLIRTGRTAEAVKICETLKTSGEVSPAALALTLEHLGVKQNTGAMKPIAEADRLRSAGKFPEAEGILNSLLAENPRNLEAAMMLVRLYLQDLNQPEKAAAVLRELEKQPHVPPDFLEFARRSIADHGNPAPAPADEAPALPGSVDELLAQGYFGTAVEVLESQIKDKPEDFELRLKLLEVQMVHCKNVSGARKMLRELQADSKFTREQLESAGTKMEEWSGAGS